MSARWTWAVEKKLGRGEGKQETADKARKIKDEGHADRGTVGPAGCGVKFPKAQPRRRLRPFSFKAPHRGQLTVWTWLLSSKACRHKRQITRLAKERFSARACRVREKTARKSTSAELASSM